MTASKSAPLSSHRVTNSVLQFVIRALFTTLLLTFSWGPAFAIGDFNLRFADLLLVLLVGLFVGQWFLMRRLPITWGEVRNRPILILLILFVLWTATSLLVTVTPALTVRRIVRVWLLLVMLVGIYELRPALGAIVNLFSLHILAQSTVAIGQALLQHDLGLRWLGEQEQIAALGYNVLDTGSRLILRVQGLAEHPNLLAITLIVPMLVVLVGTLAPSPTNHLSFPRRRESILPAAALFLGAIALFFTFSRAATLGGIVAIGLFVLLGKGKAMRGQREAENLEVVRISPPLRIILFGGGLLVMGVLVFTYRDVVLSRLDLGGSILERTSVTERAVQNRVGWEMVQASPLIGVGAHSARARFTEFLGSETYISHTIHNTVLLISAELGLPAGILWLIILAAPPIYLLQNHDSISAPALAYSVALVPYLITDFTSPASYDTPVGSLLRWLLLALWLGAIKR